MGGSADGAAAAKTKSAPNEEKWLFGRRGEEKNLTLPRLAHPYTLGYSAFSLSPSFSPFSTCPSHA